MQSSRFRSKHRLLVRSLIVIAAFIAFDVTVSVFVVRDGMFLRWPIPPWGPVTFPPQRDFMKRAEPSPGDPLGIDRYDGQLGWGYRADSYSADGLYHIGPNETRGQRLYASAPPAGVTRLACFGESYTFGSEVDDASAWPAQLEALDARCEAMNFGVGAYGTDQALLRMREKAGAFHPRVITMGIMLENIGRNVNRYRPLWQHGAWSTAAKPRFALSDGRLELVPLPFATRAELIASVTDGSVLEKLSEHEYWRDRPEILTGRWSSLARIGALWFDRRERDPRRLWLDMEGEPAQVSLALLEQFSKEAHDSGAERALILVFPTREDFMGWLERGDQYWWPFTRELSRRGLEWIDFTEPLGELERNGRSDPAGQHAYGSLHLSPAGNAVVARVIHEWIERRQWTH